MKVFGDPRLQTFNQSQSKPLPNAYMTHRPATFALLLIALPLLHCTAGTKLLQFFFGVLFCALVLCLRQQHKYGEEVGLLLEAPSAVGCIWARP